MKIAPNLILPDDAVTQTYAYIGRKGSGKTYAAGKFTELLLAAHVQVVVLDPVGNHYGLRLDKTGRKPSDLRIPILGGEHGDVPLEPAAGKIVADFIVSTGSSAVLDVSAFRKEQRRTFVTAFAEELFHRKKSHRTPMHFIIEEAQVFAPQFAKGQERMLGAIEDIVRLGRNYGIGCSMISQRPQSVNKEVLNQAEPLIVFQLVGAHERKAVADWVKHAGADVELDALPSLKTGECLFWSPAWLRTFVRTKFYAKRTFDASATPKLGEKLPKPQKLKPVDLDSLKVTMADTIAKAKADDPKLLRKQIVDLKRQVTSKAPTIDQSAIDRAVLKVAGERDRYWQALIDERDCKLAELCRRSDKIKALCDLNGQLDLTKPDAPPVQVSIAPLPQRPAFRTPARTPAALRVTAVGDVKIGRAERKVLTAMYWLRAEVADNRKVSFYSGYSPAASTVGVAMSHLRQAGLVEGWHITAEGESFIGDTVEAKPQGPELRDWLRPKLGRAENLILDLLIVRGGERVNHAEIAHATSYSPDASTIGVALSRLRKVEAIEGGEREGGVKAADVFFEGAVA